MLEKETEKFTEQYKEFDFNTRSINKEKNYMIIDIIFTTMIVMVTGTAMAIMLGLIISNVK